MCRVRNLGLTVCDHPATSQVQSYNSAAIAWRLLECPCTPRVPATGWISALCHSQSFFIEIDCSQFVPYVLIAGLGFLIPFWYLHCKYPKVGFNYVFTLSLSVSSYPLTNHRLAHCAVVKPNSDILAGASIQVCSRPFASGIFEILSSQVSRFL